MNEKRKSCILGICSVICLLALDQLTKYFASAYLKDGNSIILIKNVFQLHYLENRGAAFGLMQGMKIWFVIATILMLGILLMIYWRSPMEKRYGWARIVLILFAAGAIGNLIDRLRLDYVVDFISFVLINYPIFNVADIYVVCATIGLFIMFLFVLKEKDLEFLNFKQNRYREL